MGNTYTFTMKTRQDDFGWNSLSYIAYIDFNNDHDFEDYNEVVGSVAPNGKQLNDLMITIPTQDVITEKDITMRIVGHEGGAVTSCNSQIGNYKDFTISIKVGECEGTGHIVSFFADMDSDGFGDPDNVVLKNCLDGDLTGYVTNRKDCDDTNPNIHPNAQEICDDGIDNNCDGYTDNDNIAIGKAATNSSSAWGGLPQYAVDGNTNGNHGNGSGSGPTTHTNTEANPWWEVDLGESHTLDSIVLWNRTDCCSDRLANFYVFLSDAPFSSTDPTTTAGQAGVWSVLIADYPNPNVVINPTSSGRYLRVQINGTGILSLAEVQAYTCVQTAECTFYADADGDGYGDANISITQTDCENPPVGYVADNTDFDDSERTRYPNAMEICDNIDNNGNGEVDEGADYDAVTMNFDNEVIPTETYTASQTILTNQNVTVPDDAAVHLIAGQSITLKEGFSVAAGAAFHAEIIDNCTGAALNSEVIAEARTTINSSIQAIDNQSNMSVYPNPFRGQTTIDFSLSKTSKVNLQVFGMNGQLVETILNQVPYEVGVFSVPFSPKQSMGGIYYFVLKTDDKILTEKVVVLGE